MFINKHIFISIEIIIQMSTRYNKIVEYLIDQEVQAQVVIADISSTE